MKQMKSKVNFVIRGPHPSFYTNIMRSIVDPIRSHLADSTISEEATEDAVNVHFFHEKEYQFLAKIERGTSVFLSHGIAAKNWRDAQHMRPFDYVCVPGPMWKQKLMSGGISEERLLVVGFPKLDPIFQGMLIKTITNGQQKIVLYAPTHAKAFPECSSYPLFMDLIDGIPKDVVVISSPHPVHKSNQMPTLIELLNADVIISDSSSIIFEAWALNKPVVFPDWLVKAGILKNWPDSFTADIYRQNIGYHANTFKKFVESIYLALEHGIDQKAVAFIDEYFPRCLRGRSGKICSDKLQELRIAKK